MLVSVEAIKLIAATRPEGYKDAVMSSGVARVEASIGDVVEIPDAVYWDLVRFYSPESFDARMAIYTCGPGCQLSRSLAWWGIRDDGSCGCRSFAAQMDAWGPDECWRRIEEIVEHLREAAGKKGMPFLATAARIMVGRAIEAAKAESRSSST